MKTLCMAAVLAMSVTSAGIAAAQVVQTYVYDGNGRLIRTIRDDGSANTETAYVLDDADNRSARNTTTSSARRSARASAVESATPRPEPRALGALPAPGQPARRAVRPNIHAQ